MNEKNIPHQLKNHARFSAMARRLLCLIFTANLAAETPDPGIQMTGAGLPDPSKVIQTTQGDAWVRKSDMPTPRLGLVSCAVQGKIYAIGGWKSADDRGLATVEEYNPITDSWVAKASMPTPRVYMAAAAVNGKIYVIGGDAELLTGPLKTVEEYDPETDTWSRKADMPTARSLHAAAAVDGKIYVMGGMTTWGVPPLATVEAYDPATDTWSSKAAMPIPRATLCLSVMHGHIYAIGSGTPPSGGATSRVDRYDPMTDSWTRVANMRMARATPGCSSVNGRIYVVGGRNDASSFATVEEYDPESNTWTNRASLWSTNAAQAMPRWALTTSEMNGRIFAIGGSIHTPAPYPGVAWVHEYTPPLTAPALRIKPMSRDGHHFFQLEWQSHMDGVDSLQTQSQLSPSDWTEMEKLSGTGQKFSKEYPAGQGAAFYRLYRELR